MEVELGSILKRSPGTYIASLPNIGTPYWKPPRTILTRSQHSHHLFQELLSLFEKGQGYSPRKV